MADGNTILVGKSEAGEEVLALALANRHGLVTGATGTGKTVTLQAIELSLVSSTMPHWSTVSFPAETWIRSGARPGPDPRRGEGDPILLRGYGSSCLALRLRE